MSHLRNRYARVPDRRKLRAGPASNLETFAIRFAELALLAGVLGAGIALLVTRAS